MNMKPQRCFFGTAEYVFTVKNSDIDDSVMA